MIERFTPVAFNEVGIGLTCGYEWGPVGGERLRGAVHVQRDHRPRRGPRTGPVIRDPVAEVAAILATQ